MCFCDCTFWPFHTHITQGRAAVMSDSVNETLCPARTLLQSQHNVQSSPPVNHGLYIKNRKHDCAPKSDDKTILIITWWLAASSILLNGTWNQLKIKSTPERNYIQLCQYSP